MGRVLLACVLLAGAAQAAIHTEAAESAFRFTHVASGITPTITWVSERAGPSAGGTGVVIVGTNFDEVTGVWFGSTEARSVKVESATSISAIAPAETTGQVMISVSTPDGTSEPTHRATFTFGAPAVTRLSTNTGPLAGETELTVSGSGFAPGGETIFKFGKAIATVADCSSTTECTILAPASARPRTVDVRAMVGNKVSEKSPPGDQFTYE